MQASETLTSTLQPCSLNESNDFFDALKNLYLAMHRDDNLNVIKYLLNRPIPLHKVNVCH